MPAKTIEDRRRISLSAMQRKRAAEREVEIPRVMGFRLARRRKCRLDLCKFIETYLMKPPDAEKYPRERGWFYLPLSPRHRQMATELQNAMLHGGLLAEAAPRGFGKDTLAKAGVMWGVCYGHIGFGVFACFEKKQAINRIDDIKRQFEINRWLYEDFPEICAPIRALDRSAQRGKYQTYQGQHTRIEWGRDFIVLPTIPKSIASGAVIAAASLSGSVRGLNISGRRPDFVIITDPQTREVANSQTQTKDVLDKINADFGGLGAADRSVAALALVTVMRRHDVADQLTSKVVCPQWGGRRFGAIVKWPVDEAMALWDEYEGLLETGKRADDPSGREACRFYEANRAAMDAGAEVAWEEALNSAPAEDGTPMELSALQHFMNVRWAFGHESFLTEYQNEPSDGPQATGITAELVASRLSGFPQRIAPAGYDRLIQAIDVGAKEIHRTVRAYAADGSSSLIDCDILYPATPREVNLKLVQGAEKKALEMAVEERLRELRADLASGAITYQDPAGNKLDITLTVIDSGWGVLTDAVYRSVREGGARWRAIKGRQSETGNVKYAAPRAEPGRIIGFHWHGEPMPLAGVLLCHLDADFWKNYVHQRYMQDHGGPGAWSIWGDSPRPHKTYASHIVAEEWSVEQNKFIKVHRWNHFLDCEAYSAAGASMVGIWFGRNGQQAVIQTETAPAHRSDGERKSNWKIGR